MADSNVNKITISERLEGECSDPTVEIKIKTLDSRTYTLRVDKCVPVPALKEQIQTVTGVLSEQQRLICRGKVLKDDQLLSAYHVEDGHTLHLVVRQPFQQPTSSMTETDGSDGHAETQGSDPTLGSRRNRSGQVSHSVVLGTFNIADQGDGGIPDVNRLVSAVLNSIGIGNTFPIAGIGNGSSMVAERVTNASGISDAIQMRSDHPSDAQFNPVHGSFRFFPASSLRPLNQAMVIPDSLTTLSQYLHRMRRGFTLNGSENQSHATTSQISETEDLGSTSDLPLVPGGLPTPAALGAVIRHTQQLLMNQAGSSLSQLARQLEGEATVTDPMARAEIQTAAMRNGTIMQNLGALLLELGRTTMTLRMGQSSAESIVNAGPAVFVSTNGPNPLMVQALPFQPASGYGATHVGATHPGATVTAGTSSTGDVLRNIDIHIRTGSSLAPAASSEQGEHIGVQQIERQGNQFGSAQGGINGQQGTSSVLGESGAVRVVPVRTVVAAVPAAISGRPPAESSGSSLGVFYPLLARFQQLNPLQLTQMRGVPPTLFPGSLSRGSDNAQPNPTSSIPMSSIRAQVQVQTSVPTDSQNVRSQEEAEQASSLADATSAGETHPSVHGVPQSQTGSTTEHGILQQEPSSVHVYSIHLGSHNMQGNHDQSNGGISASEGSSLFQIPAGGQIFSSMVSEGEAGSVLGDTVDIMSQILNNSEINNISRPAVDQTGVPTAITNVIEQAMQNPFSSSQLQMMEHMGERSQNVSEMYSGFHGENDMVDFSGLLQRLMPSVSQFLGRESEASASHHGAEAQPRASSSEGPSSSYGQEAQTRTSSEVQRSREGNGAETPIIQVDVGSGAGNTNFQSNAERHPLDHSERQPSDHADDSYPGDSPATKRQKTQ